MTYYNDTGEWISGNNFGLNWNNPYCLIGPGTTIGANCTIGSGTIIGANCTIGLLPPGMRGGVRIGSNCVIASNTVIEPCEWVTDDAYGRQYTSIGDKSVIDSFVLIRTGASIGRNTYIHAHSLIAGFSEIGEKCHLATQTVVGEHCIIGDNVILMNHCIVPNGKRLESDLFCAGEHCIPFEGWIKEELALRGESPNIDTLRKIAAFIKANHKI